ncbi:MAG TPA: helix-turn-helix transcriptional regulator [Thermopolyspora sp.]|jgi:hypothetical protein
MSDTQAVLSARVAAEIRAHMGRNKVSGRALAKRMGRSPNWVSLKVSGSRSIDVDEMDLFADALDVRLADLLPADKREASTRKRRDPLEPRVIAKIGHPAEPRSAGRTPLGRLPTNRAVTQTRPVAASTRPVSLTSRG